MGAIPLSKGDWELLVEDISRVKTRNMYLIMNPYSPDQIGRITRPSLSPFADVGTGPIKAIWSEAGAIGDKVLIVSGTKIYARALDSTTVEIGNLPGTGYCDFAARPDLVVICRDGILYSTDGVTLDPIAMPGGALVSSVAGINSYFLLSVVGTNQFFWIRPFEITVDPLDFANAERYPDPLQAIRINFDEVWFLGESGPEVWSTTADSDAPFTRINGRVYSEGCESQETTVAAVKGSLPALIWVTPNRAVVLAQGQVNRISNISVEALLAEATNLRAWTIRIKRSDFYVLTCDQFSLVYDIQQDEWLRWDSYDLDYWRAHLGTQTGGNIYAGDAISGKIWKLAAEGFDDFDTPIIKEIKGYVPVLGDPVPCYSVIVRVNSGWTGTYDEPPPLEMFYSDDLGFTWSDPLFESMGSSGAYATDVEYSSLGVMSRPGRVFCFRHSGLTKLRIDFATLNQAQDEENENGN